MNSMRDLKASEVVLPLSHKSSFTHNLTQKSSTKRLMPTSRTLYSTLPVNESKPSKTAVLSASTARLYPNPQAGFHKHITAYRMQRREILGSNAVNKLGYKTLKHSVTENDFKLKMNKKEDMRRFLRKKKELLFVQMNIDNKHDQIINLEKKVVHKSERLKEVEQRIRKDLEQFNEFLDDNKQKERETTKKAESEIKNKLQAVHMFKDMQELKTSKANENARLLERIEKLLIYKDFVDKLFGQKANNDNERDEAREHGYKDKLNRLNRECQHLYGFSLPSSLGIELLKPHVKAELDWTRTDLCDTTYKNIEELNLGIILKTQQLTSEYEAAHQNFESMQSAFKTQHNVLIKRKEALLNNINLLKSIENGFTDNKLQTTNKIDQIIDQFRTKLKNIIGEGSSKPLKALSKVENRLLSYMHKLDKIDKVLVKRFEKQLIDERKMNVAKNTEELNKKLDEDRIEKLVRKDFGVFNSRRAQFRSFVKTIDDKKRMKDQDKLQEMLEEQRYFK